MIRNKIPIIICFFYYILITANCDAQNLIVLDENITHQTMTGWDVYAEAGLLPIEFYQSNMEIYYPLYIDTLLSLLVNEAGCNMIQVPIRSGMENTTDYWQLLWENQDPISRSNFGLNAYAPVNDNGNPKDIDFSRFKFSELDSTMTTLVIPLKQKLLNSSNEDLYIYFNYVDQREFTAFDHSADSSEYAEFMEACIQHIFDEYGFYVDGVNIINEPDLFNDWNNVTLVANHTKAVIDRIQQRGWDIDVMASSTMSLGRADNFFDSVWGTLSLDDTSYFKFLTYHRYSGNTASNLQDIEARILAHSSIIGGFMNEYWHPNNNYTVLHDDIKNGANSAWQQGTAGSIYFGATPFYNVDTTQSPPRVIIGEKTKYTMLYYRYVRRGAVRIEATTTNNDFDPLAFINTDGKYVVVIKANNGGNFTVQGLPPGLYGIKYTTDIEYDADLPDVNIINSGDNLTANIPAQGVITVYCKVISALIPDINVIPPSYDYSEVQLGSNLSHIFAVRNAGLANLNISTSRIVGANASEFAIINGGGPVSIPPAGTHNLEVNFSPATLGNKTATLSISSNDPYENPFEVPLTGEGINTPVKISGAELEIPQEFKLQQNYPNPFNPSTTIEFQIPEQNYVNLVIYNLNGQIIQTLVSDNLKPGYYSVEWDAINSWGSHVSSGIYFYQIKTGQFNQIKKMVLIQ